MSAVRETKPRVLRVGAAPLEPLYPATRVLASDAHAAELALAEARALRERAEVEAGALIARARSDAAVIERDARARGAAELAELRETLAREQAEQLAMRLRELETSWTQLRRHDALEVRELAVRYARAILDVEFALRPERVIELVEGLLGATAARGELGVRVSPSSATHLRAALARLEQPGGGDVHIAVCEDDAFAPHAVRLELAGGGAYEAGPDAQLAPLLARLKAARAAEVSS